MKVRLYRDGPKCPLWVCAVERRRFPVGASPTRQPLQPEATGAVMEKAIGCLRNRLEASCGHCADWCCRVALALDRACKLAQR
jgi:hypothetical protein